MSDGNDTSDLELFLEKLGGPSFQGSAGNKSLREALGWSSSADRYWEAHGRALDAGKIAVGRGRGGSVRLIKLDEPIDATPELPPTEENIPIESGVVDTTTPALEREIDLYEGARNSIELGWAKPHHFDNIEVHITALKGRSRTGGKWTRPDVSVLATRAFRYLPDRIFEIVTFEIKPFWDITVEGVFEALSHNQFSTKSYVVFNIKDEDEADKFSEKHARVLDTARIHGIGLIVATNVSDYDTWDEVVAPIRTIADPEQTDRFIASSFPEEVREKVIKWHK